jgi:hypothetical protein
MPVAPAERLQGPALAGSLRRYFSRCRSSRRASRPATPSTATSKTIMFPKFLMGVLFE